MAAASSQLCYNTILSGVRSQESGVEESGVRSRGVRSRGVRRQVRPGSKEEPDFRLHEFFALKTYMPDWKHILGYSEF